MTTADHPSKLTRRKVKVPSNIERKAFLFMRTTGVLLLVLAVGHVLMQHVARTSGDLNLHVVADIWNSWGWRIYDLLLLVFAITHGFNGLRNVLEDYIHNRSAIKYINIFLIIFMTITIAVSAYAIITFDSAEARKVADAIQAQIDSHK